jgi:hypothetical protein
MPRVTLTNLTANTIFVSKPRATLAPAPLPGFTKIINGVKAADLDGNRDLERLVDTAQITVAVADDPAQADTQEGVVRSEPPLYTAAFPPFWAGPPPTNLNDAVERILAYLQPPGAALPGGPIP